ncbi:hypothetical protein KMZ93_09715 [Bradyrhizobium sediminis]|uniref:Uncharacterized protein n=1 Tax=Bradyrhizobium sediminis TaxID=2840469 RepID=A0A975RYU0_9BRAD|nr:hypothetical protein [Bradyrhizobium sediminis]QWG25125.1 hypothetical protein KMZ93_09715 [Bradyrhizobium sediminis]
MLQVALLDAMNMIAGMKSRDHGMPEGIAMVARLRLDAGAPAPRPVAPPSFSGSK